MEIALGLSLPRDRESIPVVRRMVRHALDEVGVEESCTYDVELALSEACTNVLLHSGPGDEYEVRLEIDDRQCELRVVDVGHGFQPPGLRRSQHHPDPEAERGRGLVVMRAVVDQAEFVSKPAAGTVVHLQKTLAYRGDSIGGRHLSDSGTSAAG
jgi:anti-sigma regulatory factor (Ser/Thr protein kinase)